ncbi:MAG: 1-(5-phosphoribosyl)-5-[(5-phosphoribosylamino)methylideneamino]imidazole-4-carboxamide isomerase [Anaerolineaceae bacterium]|nr:1-(5-phosphoribosyl)-5-[(5-phosphoribosylamino)methylideneamino]imidazole-4-carboxamide isomerase [Anaerolineaceae bacterium]
MNSSFNVYPAIDLHLGQVVRLMQGDLGRQTQYKNTPADTATRWISSGTKWLHVINLDGAFGTTDQANLQALKSILAVTQPAGVKVQFGGGIRSMQHAENAFNAGVERVILGTVVTQQPEFLAQALKKWGHECVAVSLDTEDGFVKTHGWQEGTTLQAIPFAKQLAEQGLKWLIYTDIARDGLLQGLNLAATSELSQATGLSVIASGGVEKLSDVEEAKAENLAGAIIGKALYEQKIQLDELTQFIQTL